MYHSFIFQALDEEYLKVDAQFGGVDQRKIFMFAEKVTQLHMLSLIRIGCICYSVINIIYHNRGYRLLLHAPGVTKMSSQNW